MRNYFWAAYLWKFTQTMAEIFEMEDLEKVYFLEILFDQWNQKRENAKDAAMGLRKAIITMCWKD